MLFHGNSEWPSKGLPQVPLLNLLSTLSLACACPAHILALASTSGCWSPTQSGPAPDPDHMYSNGCCRLTQPGLPTALTLTYTSGSCSPVRESLEFPYQMHSKPWVLHVLEGASTPLDIVWSQSQLSLLGVAAYLTHVQSTLCPGSYACQQVLRPGQGLINNDECYRLVWSGPLPIPALVLLSGNYDLL